MKGSPRSEAGPLLITIDCISLTLHFLTSPAAAVAAGGVAGELAGAFAGVLAGAVAGVLAGAAAGAVAGVLDAPAACGTTGEAIFG